MVQCVRELDEIMRETNYREQIQNQTQNKQNYKKQNYKIANLMCKGG